MLSIIIPVYNVEQYLVECLESIVNQTYQDIEIIIVDDGSTDNSKNIIIDYARRYSYIRPIFQKNLGVSIARNNALELSKGDYILFIDPDDYIDKTYAERMISVAECTDCDIVICRYAKKYDNPATKLFYVERSFIDYRRVYSGEEVAEMMLQMKLEGYLWDKLFKRSHLINSNFSFEPNRYIQDWYPVFKEVVNSKKIVFIEDYLYYYRQRLTSTVNKKSLKKLNDYAHAANKIINYSNSKKLNNYAIQNFQVNVLMVLIKENIEIDSKCTCEQLKKSLGKNNNLFLPKEINYYFSLRVNLKQKLKCLLIFLNLIK